jgi:O-antigen ligase
VKTIVILEKLTDLLLYSLFFFAVATLFISADLVISGQYRGLLRDTFKSIFGLHYNSVATILMLGLPLALSRSLSSGRGWVIIFGTLTVALLFAQSRGAILGGISGIMAFLYLQRKLDARLLIAIIFIGLLGFVLSDIIITLFSRGLESRDFSEISSGRLDSMWIPLISELTTNPYRILFGFGLYGMIMTDAYMFSSDFFQATHAHNAYLNLIVDGGLIVFLPFVFLLFYSFKHAMTISRKFNNSTFNALLSSVIVYLVAGMSGRQFTPNTGNAMLFIIIAILVTIVITKKQAK